MNDGSKEQERQTDVALRFADFHRYSDELLILDTLKVTSSWTTQTVSAEVSNMTDSNFQDAGTQQMDGRECCR